MTHRDVRSRGGALTLGALVMAVSLVSGGCDWPWPRDNPLDPDRCDPECVGGAVCRDGVCLSGDAGPRDAALDGPVGDRGLVDADGLTPDQGTPDLPPGSDAPLDAPPTPDALPTPDTGPTPDGPLVDSEAETPDQTVTPSE